MQDYYALLGVDQKSGTAEIKAAYRKLALHYHPDRNAGDAEAEERFKAIAEAYRVLSDPTKRFLYDNRSFVAAAPSPSQPFNPRHRDPYFNRKKEQPANPPRNSDAGFSKRTKILGGVFVGLLVVLVICIPITLQVYASVHNYNEAKALYENGKNFEAIQKLEWSYRFFGVRNLVSAKLATLILAEELKYYKQSIPHILKGIKYAESSEDEAWFYLKKGISHKHLNEYEPALRSFHFALDAKPEWDSALYHLGEVHTFAQRDYQTGIFFFTRALEVNPFFADCFMGRGYCHYQLKNFDVAVLDFNSFLKHSTVDRATGFYLRGMALLESKYPEVACQDFMEAWKLGSKGGRDAYEKNCR